jgi:hypothetical protein
MNINHLENSITEDEFVIVCTHEIYEDVFYTLISQENERVCTQNCTYKDLDESLECKCVKEYDRTHPLIQLDKYWNGKFYCVKLKKRNNGYN